MVCGLCKLIKLVRVVTCVIVGIPDVGERQILAKRTDVLYKTAFVSNVTLGWQNLRCFRTDIWNWLFLLRIFTEKNLKTAYLKKYPGFYWQKQFFVVTVPDLIHSKFDSFCRFLRTDWNQWAKYIPATKYSASKNSLFGLGPAKIFGSVVNLDSGSQTCTLIYCVCWKMHKDWLLDLKGLLSYNGDSCL